jgi:sugar phosphate isomerase/epimerase
MNRRTFIQTVASAALTTPSLIAAASSSARPRIALGVDTYTLRDFRWNVFQQLDYAAQLKLDTIQATSANFESVEVAYLQKAKDHAARVGVGLEFGYGCVGPLSKRWNPKQGDPRTYLLEGLRVTRALGATVFKCYAGNAEDRRSSVPIPAQMEATIKALKTVRSELLDAGVKVALENHGDFLAREVKTIIEEAGKEFVGSNLDTGNPTMLGEDPLLALEVLGPYVISTHVRDSVVYEHERGAAVQWVALGDGTIDFRQFVARFAELCPKAPFHLEIITGGGPKVLPYFEADYWQAFPNLPAADFARFVKLAKAGHPFTGKMVMAASTPPAAADKAAFKEQQRVDFERSIEYCKKRLGLGVRWQA